MKTFETDLLEVEKDIWNHLEEKGVGVNFVWLKGRRLIISLGCCDLSINQIRIEVQKICNFDDTFYDSFILEI